VTHPSIHPLVSLSGAFDEDLRVTLDSASVTALESGARKGTVARQGARPGVAGVTIDIGRGRRNGQLGDPRRDALHAGRRNPARVLRSGVVWSRSPDRPDAFAGRLVTERSEEGV